LTWSATFIFTLLSLDEISQSSCAARAGIVRAPIAKKRTATAIRIFQVMSVSLMRV
jgi:hypothetical protein